MKRAVSITALGLMIIFLLGNNGLSDLTSNSNVHNSPPTNPVHFVHDDFVSVNATDTSQIISLDSKDKRLIGCGVFSGTIQNSKVTSTQTSAAGGSDILLFGWDKSNGYWSTSIGGTGNDLCQKASWIDEHRIGIAGSFENTIAIGANYHTSNGGTDGFFSTYNVTSKQWVDSVTLGSSLDDNFNSFVHLTNGSYVVLGTTKGNISQHSSIQGAPQCAPTAPATSTQCTILLYLDNALIPNHIQTIESTGSVLGTAITEVGTSGKTIVAGYFNRELLTYPSNVHANDLPLESQNNGNDIFIGRFGQNGDFENLNIFGGNGSDLVYDIHAYGNGYILAGITQSTQNSAPTVTYPPNGNWVAPTGFGNRDMIILQTTTSGAIVDGFLLGTSGHDLLYSIEVDDVGLVHMAGYIGTSWLLESNQTIGQIDTRSVFHGIANLSGGNNSHLVQAHASSGSNTGDGIAFAVTATSNEDVWVGGRMIAGAQSNTFFGNYASGFADSGFLSRIGTDADADSVAKRSDNCPDVPNTNQLNYDLDSSGDACDHDDDDDGIPDAWDTDCPRSIPLGFRSMNTTDHDGDGCSDVSEDLDDDNDGFSDTIEQFAGCPKGHVNWTAGDLAVDRDADGCHDQYEDEDDDGDNFNDDYGDQCAGQDSVVFDVSNWSDYDLDGCHDIEDQDIDGDLVPNAMDSCPNGRVGWISNLTYDYDDDGCEDFTEDLDDDNDGVLDHLDQCTPPLTESVRGDADFSVWYDHDADGCHDDEDVDDDDDGVIDALDLCPLNKSAWQSLGTDLDIDGCEDSSEDIDDDNDGVTDEFDVCDPDSGVPFSLTTWLSNASNDRDTDGCKDSGPENSGYGEDLDDDNDGYLDAVDACSQSDMFLDDADLDGDGCLDSEDSDMDGDGFLNVLDSCPKGIELLVKDEDNDGCDRLEDEDDDNDGVLDEYDMCDPNDPGPYVSEWSPVLLPEGQFTAQQDIDADGCADESPEDLDDDNDSVLDIDDMCDSNSKSPPYVLDWVSNTQTDVDRDGCRDADEDLDDDNDGIADIADECDPDSAATFKIGWTSDKENDVNSDGCRDADEDLTLMAESNQNDERVFLYTMMALVGAIITVVVLLIVSGRVKGTTIIGGDNSIIKANIAHGASNIVETGSNIQSSVNSEEE